MNKKSIESKLKRFPNAILKISYLEEVLGSVGSKKILSDETQKNIYDYLGDLYLNLYNKTGNDLDTLDEAENYYKKAGNYDKSAECAEMGLYAENSGSESHILSLFYVLDRYKKAGNMEKVQEKYSEAIKILAKGDYWDPQSDETLKISTKAKFCIGRDGTVTPYDPDMVKWFRDIFHHIDTFPW
jgi:tetratricopeptide (TPR) repeat protein